MHYLENAAVIPPRADFAPRCHSPSLKRSNCVGDKTLGVSFESQRYYRLKTPPTAPAPASHPHRQHETYIAFRPRARAHPGQVSALRKAKSPAPSPAPANITPAGSLRKAISSSPFRRITPSARGTAQMASASVLTRATSVPSGPSMSTLTPACSRPAAQTTP